MRGLFTAAVIKPGDPEWHDVEKALDKAGRPLALPSRLAWAELMAQGRGRLVVVRAGNGEPVFATSVLSYPSRIMPWNEVWRVERLGVNAPAEAVVSAIHSVAAEAARHKRVLRVEATVVTPDVALRRTLADEAARAGFVSRTHPERIYEYTLVIDLTTAEPDALFSTLGRKTRRDIRLPARRGLEICALDDPAFGPRLDELSCAAMERTGGAPLRTDWQAVMALCRRHPGRSRLLGTFAANGRSPDDLLAFAWGCHHGEYAHYEAGGSMRQQGVNIPMSYALLWDLIVWAQSNGACWFDLGGVTRGTSANDRLQGISEMKRYFSRVEAHVGEEWVFEPNRASARLATIIGRLVRGKR